MSVLITGVAGFIGSNLARKILSNGIYVFGIDNLSNGNFANISDLNYSTSFSFKQVEMTNFESYQTAFNYFHNINPITEVWHFAANSNIPAGINDLTLDLNDTFITTINTLRLMQANNIRIIAFASSSAIYGDLGDCPLVEDIGPLLPISNYGAMKLSSEATISAATENNINQAFIFRFPNVVGVPATHGVILDFIHKLKASPDNLVVLGNGTQTKEYLHIDDLIDAMLYIRDRAVDKLAYFNIGTGDGGVTVRFIAEETVRIFAPYASISYGNGNKGWIGDVPRFKYSINKLKSLGWIPKMSSKDAVTKAIQEITTQVLKSK